MPEETYRREDWMPMARLGPWVLVAYRADGEEPNPHTAEEKEPDLSELRRADEWMEREAWIPAAEMPRWASRTVAP